MGVCKFCNENEAIKNSHIIPSFIFSWIKDTSATRKLRESKTPNKRLQDGIKKDLLCKSCEEKFSKLESCFKKEFFSKTATYREILDSITLSEESLFCLFSIFWRGLAMLKYYPPKDSDLIEKDQQLIDIHLSILKDGIIKTDVNLQEKINIVHVSPQNRNKSNTLPKNITPFFYERCVGHGPLILEDPYRFMLIVNIPFSIFTYTLTDLENINDWKNTKFSPSFSLKLTPEIPQELIDYILNRNADFEKGKSLMDQEALIKCVEKSLKNENCGSYKTLRNNKTC